MERITQGGNMIRKTDIRTMIGMRAMSLNRDLDLIATMQRMNRFFKSCRTIAEMQHRIELNGGYEKVAEIIATSYPYLEYRIK